MTTRSFWGRIIRARWFKALPAALLLASLLGAQTLESLARDYPRQPTPARRRALLDYAAGHARETSGALALLVVGAVDCQRRDYAEAIRQLRAAKARLGPLSDYAGYWLAEALTGARQFAEALGEAEAVVRYPVPSPWTPKALPLAVGIRRQTGEARRAVELLRAHASLLPQAQGTQLLASSLEAAKDLPAAAVEYQRVYYEHPRSAEAAEAGAALARLRSTLGESYPPPLAQAMLGRASKLLDAGEHVRARRELESLVGQLGGAEKELARVRLGLARQEQARLATGEREAALRYLQSLELSEPDADAERWRHVVAGARRLDRESVIQEALERLRSAHTNSRWRLDALVAAGNHYLLRNRRDAYEPVYRACYESFPAEPQAALCHWRVSWSRYLGREPDAARLLREHVERFPASEQIPAALFFLGRLAEADRDAATAKGCYALIGERYPNYYYSILARERLGQLPRQPANGVARALQAGWVKPTPLDFAPDAATRTHLERARLLASAALGEWAENELRYAAGHGASRPALAIELAQLATRRGATEQGLRYVKALAPTFLLHSFEALPPAFWKLAFPWPFRESIEKAGRERSLDEFLLAGLIRQESEFDPRAVSRAQAYGLTQIRPVTGRFLGSRLGLGTFRTSMLYQPETNLRMGAYMLRWLLDGLDGRMEEALAAYNAGRSRALDWRGWAQFREPAEFIETIPFTETRNYVQTVLRNAEMYRRLYGRPTSGVPSTGGVDQDLRPAGGGPRVAPVVP